MMMVMVTPETAKIEVREGFSLAFPKFFWTVLEARAKTLHQGDLKVTVQELVAEELLKWFQAASRKVVSVPAPSIN